MFYLVNVIFKVIVKIIHFSILLYSEEKCIGKFPASLSVIHSY